MRTTLILHLALAVGASAVCSTALGEGTSYSWCPEGQAGYWTVEANWDPDRSIRLPDDEMYVNKSGGSVCNYDRSNETIGLLVVDVSNTMNHPEAKTLHIQTYLYVAETYGTTSTYNLTGGTLEVLGQEWIGKTGNGFFNQTGDAGHTAKGGVSVGGPSGHGYFSMYSGTLTVGTTDSTVGNIVVGHTGEGWFVQDGGQVHIVKRITPEEGGGCLLLGTMTANGTYTLNAAGEEDLFSVDDHIEVGECGRFEWFAGEIESANEETPVMELYSKGTLAMGYDFEVTWLLGLVQDGWLEGLEGATLEITHAGTATHDSQTLTVRKLNVGDSLRRYQDTAAYWGTYELDGGTVSVATSCDVGGRYACPGLLTMLSGSMTVADDLNIGCWSVAWPQPNPEDFAVGEGEVCLEGGTLTIEGDCFVGGREEGQAGDGTLTIKAGELLLDGSLNLGEFAFEDPDEQMHGSGTLAIGDGQQTDATIVLPQNLTFGERSAFTVTPVGESTCTFHVTGIESKVFIVAVNPTGDNNCPLPGLADTTFIFFGEDDESTMSIEAAGVNNGLPSEQAFNTENFTLHKLIVGNTDENDPESTYGPVELVLSAQEDNQEQWQGAEALYVDILTIDPGGTFDLSNAALYFLRTSAEGQADPRQLFLGDADLDGDVDFTDYQALERNFGTTAGALWGQGDFDGDRDVDFTDYQILERNYGQGERGEGREGDAGAERLDSEGRALPVLKDYDGDGDVDIDDLRILQAMRQEEDEP